MKVFNLFLALMTLTLVLISCDDDDNEDVRVTVCDDIVLIDADEYLNAPDDLVTINSVEITDDCLNINFSAGGCSGDSWEVKLIDSEAILESLPPQRNLRLSLKNEELCQAYITRALTFDISALQIECGQVLLNIHDFEEQLSYEY